MQYAKIVFIVRLAEAIDLGYASQHQFDETVLKILNHPFVFPLTARVEVLGVYKQGIVALKGKTCKASLISTPSEADAEYRSLSDISDRHCPYQIRKLDPPHSGGFVPPSASSSIRESNACFTEASVAIVSPICSSLSSHFLRK